MPFQTKTVKTGVDAPRRILAREIKANKTMSEHHATLRKLMNMKWSVTAVEVNPIVPWRVPNAVAQPKWKLHAALLMKSVTVTPKKMKKRQAAAVMNKISATREPRAAVEILLMAV